MGYTSRDFAFTGFLLSIAFAPLGILVSILALADTWADNISRDIALAGILIGAAILALRIVFLLPILRAATNLF